ncbi:DUF7405 family protein [Halorussus salinisoli]|uniref:DUF7405 family protein n=1 Tax=Halorussus salinisoli TaxID=2558242 RepID=UPI0010C19434|nr:hypothetical protein [Halorussus salinisoli]
MNLYGLSDDAAAVSGDHDESGPITIVERNNRQHAWDDFILEDDEHGLAPPRHHLLLCLDYRKPGQPTSDDRQAVAGALGHLEAAFEWSNRGLLFTIGYAPGYFDRFDEPLPPGIDLRPADEVIDAIKVGDEDPTPEPYEIIMHLSSNNAVHLLAAEEALWGFPGQDRDHLNGVHIEHTFEGIFEKPTTFPGRRTGFVGASLPKQEIHDTVDEDLGDAIHGDAPLSMGFESGLDDNLPDETAVSLVHDQTLSGDFEQPGVFAQGTIEHVSKLDLDLDGWYDQTKEERIHRMFSPHHTESDVGEVGEELGSTSGTDEMPMRDHRADDAIARHTQEDAEEQGLVGHAQKLARARFDVDLRQTDAERDPTRSLDTTILRRDFDTTDQQQPGLHFVALMRFNGYMVYTRRAMNGVRFDSETELPSEPGELEGTRITHEDVELPIEDDGFLAFITAQRRGNYLVPPLELRALPPARALRLDIDMDITRLTSLSEGRIPVVIRRTEAFDPKTELDLETVRFGPPAVVDQGGGATPVDAGPVNEDMIETADLLLEFEAADAGFDNQSTESRLFGKTNEGYPVQSTAEMVVDLGE